MKWVNLVSAVLMLIFGFVVTTSSFDPPIPGRAFVGGLIVAFAMVCWVMFLIEATKVKK